jgi:hypothetical protein
LEAELRGRLADANAAPFLGHHPFPPEASEALPARLVRGEFLKALRGLFWKWPALTACWIARTVRERYGEEDDQRFWPLLAELFGREVHADERAMVAKNFAWACGKLDLARSSEGSHVDRIVVQAGAPTHQLDMFVRRCLEAERVEGLPDPEDETGFQRFVAAVAERLRPNNPRLARVLEADPTGWYLRRWIALRLELDDPADHDFSAALRAALERVPERTPALAVPRLVWGDGGLAVRLPRLAEGRILLEVAGSALALDGPREEERVSLAELGVRPALSAGLRWRIETKGSSRGGNLPLPAADGSELAIFAPPGGTLVERAAFTSPPTRRDLPPGPLVVVAAGRFTGPDGPAEPLDDGLFVTEIGLGSEPVTLRRGALAVELAPEARPRIVPTVLPAFVALGGEVVHAGPELEVRVEHPSHDGVESYVLRVEVDAVEQGWVPLHFEEGAATTDLAPVLRTLPARLLRCRLGLVRKGERRALARARLLVWNHLEAVDNGRFRGPPPENLDRRESRPVVVDAAGVALVRDQRYLDAVLVFTVGEERLELRLPARDPVALVERREPGGHLLVQLLEPAEPIVVQPGDPRMLEIRCPDPAAELRLGSRLIHGAFRHSPAFRCALLAAAEHCRTAEPVLAVRLSSGIELPLGRLTVATEALEWRALREPLGGPVEALAFRLREPVGALWLDAEELFAGRRAELELAPDGLDRTEPGTGLVARLHQDPGREPYAYRLELPRKDLPGGLWLLRFEVSESDAPADRRRRAPSNPRGDAFGWLIEHSAERLARADLEGALGIAGTAALFARTHRALLRCWALPAWQNAGVLGVERWWRRAALVIDGHPGRRRLIAALLPLACEDPPLDAAPSWLPILGFWHVFPDHLALPAQHFAELASARSEPARRLAATAEIATAGGLARALYAGHHVAPAFLGCFANLARASTARGAVELRGFDFNAWTRHLREAVSSPGPRRGTSSALDPSDFAEALQACRQRWDLVKGSGGFERHRPTAMTVLTAARRWLERHGVRWLRERVPQLRGEFSAELDLERRGGDALQAELPGAIAAVALACRLEPRRTGSLDTLLASLAEQTADRRPALDGLQFLWGLARELFAFWLLFWEVLLITGDRRA